MNLQTTIKKWGNSLALRLSGPMSSLPYLKENAVVMVHATDEGFEVKPAKNNKRLPFSESELLEGLTAKRAHADEVVQLSKKELGE